MIVRNLLLAGREAIKELTPQKQTVLHLAAAHDQPQLASIFIENGVQVDAVDDNLNNALHVAIKVREVCMMRYYTFVLSCHSCSSVTVVCENAFFFPNPFVPQALSASGGAVV